jgi:uncharacterized protein with FMN-binding domain
VKRIVLWFLSTLSVVVLLFGYHTSTSGAGLPNSPVSVISGSAAGTGPAKGPAPGSSGSTGSSGSSKSAHSASAGAGSSGSSTVTGDVASTQWGPVQVDLTVSNGTITDVSVVQYPSGSSKDAEINGYALPTLIQETIDAQSANIDMVSGATVTSVGYTESLQSALDRAGL